MALLDGFTLIELKQKVEESTLTIGSNSLKFNRGTARNLGRPPKVRFFVNEKLLQLAITPSQEDDEDGVDFSYDENTRERPITVKDSVVMNAINKLVVLEKEGQALQMVMKGNVYLEEATIIYDLTEAETVAVKSRGRITAKKAESKNKE